MKIKENEIEFDDKGRMIISNKELIAELKKRLKRAEADVSGQGTIFDNCSCCK